MFLWRVVDTNLQRKLLICNAMSMSNAGQHRTSRREKTKYITTNSRNTGGQGKWQKEKRAAGHGVMRTFISRKLESEQLYVWATRDCAAYQPINEVIGESIVVPKVEN